MLVNIQFTEPLPYSVYSNSLHSAPSTALPPVALVLLLSTLLCIHPIANHMNNCTAHDKLL